MEEERYKRLFTMEKNMYSDGSPLLICAGALLKDNRNGKIIAQLKFKNVMSKIVVGVGIKVQTFDVFGKELIQIDGYQYKDLHVKRNETFGEQNGILVSDDNSRKMEVTIETVLFEDGSMWKAIGQEWKKAEIGKKLSEVYEDEELVKQFKLELGNQAEFVFTQGDGYWNCICGNFNNSKEEICYMCGIKKSKILETSFENIIEKKNIRICQEKAEKEKEEQIKKEKDAYNKTKRKKFCKVILKISIVLVIVVGLILGGIILNSKVFRPRKLYNLALEYIHNEQYERGYEILRGLGNYSDAAEQIKYGQYNQALNLLEKKQYDEGYEILRELGDYSDSEEQINDNILERVDLALENDEYTTAINLLGQSTLPDIDIRTKEVEYLQARYYIENNYKEKALNILKDLNYKDSTDLFHEVCYEYAVSLLDAGQYDLAITYFSQIMWYLDSSDKLKEAKYEYVVNRKDMSWHENYYEYLMELKDENYKDSENIYREVYTPSVVIFVNQTAGNDNEDLPTVHAAQRIYFHYEFSGLIPNANMKDITYKLQDGNTVTKGDLSSCGSVGYVETGYTFYSGQSSILKCTFYDKNGNVIGSKSVKVVP